MNLVKAVAVICTLMGGKKITWSLLALLDLVLFWEKFSNSEELLYRTLTQLALGGLYIEVVFFLFQSAKGP